MYLNDFNMFHHNLKSVYANKNVNSFDKLQAFLKDISDLFTGQIGVNEMCGDNTLSLKRSCSQILHS